ncbi:MAG: DUF166 domain-containing protein [Candidatus Methanoperedens sp.]|jgi:hypothetical protein|nr:DUF166 domain-containing protein [Candidatus Methanoperedens sp.]PKL54384.1 MAG: hypothetical protein CVV36_02030 [Candidatus Methanoperedenaceae archaeon HGW-Methanoperedenaceae-1]
MITIGVLTRGKYGKRLIENILKNSGFDVFSQEIPQALPEFIDEPEELIKRLSLDTTVFSRDLVITYILHPDITPGLVRLAGENGAGAVIIAGGMARAGSYLELSEIAGKYGMHIEVHEICCEIDNCQNQAIDEFASRFGKPELRINAKNGTISGVDVIRGAPCGSTWHMAKGLAGIKLEDAPAKAGLLIQQYPCRAVRGIKGGIHKAAELHKRAVENALKGEN